MAEIDLAWLAGFMDGEGSLGIRVTRRPKDSRLLSTSSVIRIAQAGDRTWILDELRSEYGGSVQNKHIKNPNHTQAKELVISGIAARELCVRLLPFLKLKKRHAQIIIEHEATKDKARIGTRKGTKRDSFRVPEEVIQLREQQIEELKELNVRGTKRRSGQTSLRPTKPVLS